MKALEKDRNRRYSTPGNFAEDIERYLQHEAIQARPPSKIYRLKKLSQRNRGAVVTAAVVALGALAERQSLCGKHCGPRMPRRPPRPRPWPRDRRRTKADCRHGGEDGQGQGRGARGGHQSRARICGRPDLRRRAARGASRRLGPQRHAAEGDRGGVAVRPEELPQPAADRGAIAADAGPVVLFPGGRGRQPSRKRRPALSSRGISAPITPTRSRA